MDHCLDVGDQEISWFEGVLSLFYFSLFYFRFSETPQFQGVPLLLLGTLLCSRECVGILGSCASMRNAPDLRIPGTFLTLIVSLHSSGCFTLIPFYFVVYSIYTRSCIVVTYPFASDPPPETTGNLFFFVLITRTIYA
jgi:hypothetical protein